MYSNYFCKTTLLDVMVNLLIISGNVILCIDYIKISFIYFKGLVVELLWQMRKYNELKIDCNFEISLKSKSKESIAIN